MTKKSLASDSCGNKFCDETKAELVAALQTIGMIADGDEPDGYHITNGADRLEAIVKLARAALAKGGA